MARKKSLKKSKTRYKKYKAPCKRTKYSKSRGTFSHSKHKGGKSKKCKGGKRKKTKRRSSKRGG